MTVDEPHRTNVALAEALGLDPNSVRAFTVRCRLNQPPIVDVEHSLHRLDEKGGLATELRRYELVELPDAPKEPSPRVYTAAEKAAHQPAPCPHCDATLTINWIDVTTRADGAPESAWAIGSLACHNCDPTEEHT